MTNKLKVPAIGEYERHIGKLIKVETIQPPPYNEYIFEDMEARCELRRNGKLIKELWANNDFYGQGTSVKIAIEEMEKYCAENQITKDSEIEAVIIKVVSQIRMLPEWRENFYAKGYTDFKSTDWGSKRDLPDDIEEVVWSSKKDLEVKK